MLECVTEMRLSPQPPAAQRRDFPFAEIRIIAILSLIEHRRTALSACVCDCEDGLFCTRPLPRVRENTERERGPKIRAYKCQCVREENSLVTENLREIIHV